MRVNHTQPRERRRHAEISYFHAERCAIDRNDDRGPCGSVCYGTVTQKGPTMSVFGKLKSSIVGGTKPAAYACSFCGREYDAPQDFCAECGGEETIDPVE